MTKTDSKEDYWDLVKELDNHFYDKFGCRLYNAEQSKKIIDKEYARKKGKDLSELDDDGKLTSVSKRTLQYYWRKDEKKTLKEEEDKRPNDSTLDIICVCIGYATWDDFCMIVRREIITEDTSFNPEDYVVEKMEKGKKYKIGWFPRYFIELEYIGNYEFKVISQSYNLRKRYDINQKITIYGFGLQYIPHLGDKVTGSITKYVEGYPLFPTLTIRTTPQKKLKVEESFHVRVIS